MKTETSAILARRTKTNTKISGSAKLAEMMRTEADKFPKRLKFGKWPEYVARDIEIVSRMRFVEAIWVLSMMSTKLCEAGLVLWEPGRECVTKTAGLDNSIFIGNQAADGLWMLEYFAGARPETQKVFRLSYNGMDRPELHPISMAAAVGLSALHNHKTKAINHDVNSYLAKYTELSRA